MGLAASQGRLLLLTARKSDLELQAQSITQQRLLLAIQQETIAEEYADKTNNQIFQIRLDGASEYSPLSIASLNSLLNGNATSDYKLSADKSEVTSGKYGIFDTRTNKYIDPKDIKGDTGDTPYSKLQQNLESGAWVIRTPETRVEAAAGASGTREVKTMGDLMIGADSRFRQTYFTQDDNKAKADYDKAMARVQRLDKQLELKLNQVETQHKAVETEVESVDKIISNNIESSFKYFS